MKRVFTKLVCAALSATMLMSCAPAVDYGNMSMFAIQAEAATAITAVADGKNETVYAEWTPVSGAAKYEAYYKASSASSYTQADDQLIRQYPTYWRVDVPGLKAGSYDLKIVAKNSSGSEIANYEKKSISVSAYQRVGFAFSAQSTYKTGSGAYNDDGTLRSGAKVFYVTKDTAKTITANVITDSKGSTTACKGFQAIIAAKEKGFDKTPFDFRIIGTITASDMDSLGSSEEGLQVKGKSYTEMNITIEGIGNDAAIKDFGILVRNVGNVEFRNFAILNCLDDCLSLDTDNCNIWIHNVDFFYGKTGSDSDQAKGDGTTDLKAGSTYITISNNHYWDSGKSSLCGMKSDNYTDYYVTYANNWFDHSDSRHPRIRGGNIHVYNNYYDGNAKYGVGMTSGGSAFAENNYFRNCKDPMLISKQGTDAKGDGTFSGEDGGYIKEYGNIMVGSYYFLPGEDAYCAASKNEKVPSSYVAKVVNSGVVYSNFDTASTMYSYTPIAAKDVPAYVTENAGRINHGDFTWDFDNSTEDTNYAVNASLKSAIEGYKSTLASVGGTVKSVSGGSASSVTGVDGNKNIYSPATKLASLNLPTATDESGNKATGGTGGGTGGTTGGGTVTSYDLQFQTSDITSKKTLTSTTDVTGTKGTFTVIATSDKNVTLDTSKGIALGGSGSTSSRAVQFTTTSAGTVYVTCSSGGSDVRNLNVSDGTTVVGTIVTGATGSVALPKAGTYYLYSAGSGINISFIGVSYGTAATESTTESTTAEATTKATTESTTESTTQAPVQGNDVKVNPSDAGSYSFSSATAGTLTLDTSYGGAYANLNTAENKITVSAAGAALTDTSSTLATNLVMPLGKTYTTGKLTISGSVTPSAAASKWAYIDIQGTNGSVLKIGTDANKKNAISAKTDASNANVYVSSATAAAASKINYTAVLDLTNKKATVTMGSDTITTDLVNTSVSKIASTTSVSGSRNITVGDVTVAYEGTTTPDPQPTVLKGDANDDGVVDKADVSCILTYLVGNGGTVSDKAEVTGDGAVTVADAYKISQYVLGIINQL